MGHEALDMRTFASWGVDYVKVDFCGYKTGPTEGGLVSVDPGRQYQAWSKLGLALNATGKRIWFSVCPHSPASEPMAWQPPPMNGPGTGKQASVFTWST